MPTNPIHPLRRFFVSLRFKLSFWVGLIVFLSVVVFTYHTLSIQEENLVNARVQAALQESEAIKAAIRSSMMTEDREAIGRIVTAVGEQERFQEINIYDRRGILRYTSSARPVLPSHSFEGELQNPLLTDVDTNASARFRFLDDGQVLNLVNLLVNAASCATAACHAHPQSFRVLGALELKLPMRELRDQILKNARRIYLFAFLLFLLVSTLIGMGVIFLVSRRIGRLEEKARKMASGKYYPQETVKGFDSIAMLSRSFDKMSRQINERTRQLEESRRMYRELFEKVPCYISVIDRKYRIVRTNQVFTDEFGDQVGTHCFAARKGRDSKCENCQVEKTFLDGFSHRYEEVWHPGSEGKKAYVIIHTSPIFDSDGNVAEVMELSLDVSRMVRLQLELDRKEAEYRNLIETVPCYLTVIDRSFTISFYNKMFARDFGDSMGQKCFKVYKGLDAKCDNCPVEKTFADGGHHSSEEVWYRHGEAMYIVSYASPITDENGEIVAVMEMCTNVTEVKLLQNQLAALGETIAVMSHGVKNILSGLEGGVYMVDSGLKMGKDDRIHLGWDMVKRNVAKVSDLVKDILYASKEREPEYQECDPGGILQDVYNLYEGKARSNGIDLIKDFDSEMGAGFLDPKGIHSVISNLVSNAIEACQKAGGPEKHHITITGSIEHSRVVIGVADDGTGMPEEVRQNLFKKFYSTKGPKGTGLGLVVTRKIIEEHGGTIRVESELGKGSTFSVEIPLRGIESKKAIRSV